MAATKKTARKKSTTRKKTSATSRKTTTARKKTTTARKKTTTPRKKTATARKKAAPTRKYSRKASEIVGTELDEMKHGKLRSGRSGKKVTSRKQAIAIGLSEARRSGEAVPPNPNGRRKKS